MGSSSNAKIMSEENIVAKHQRMQALAVMPIPVDLRWNVLLILEYRIAYRTNLGLGFGKTRKQNRHPHRP